MAHRGPDGAGEWFGENIGMAFRRLAILDLSSAADQPMTSEDGVCTLVFNGAIYNYVELRNELVALGHRFTSSGDTEVLLHAYLQWGAECLPRFNGMWAFVIYDRRRRLLFGSRDRFGLKPLYVFRSAEHVILGSEIKAIAASGIYVPGTNWEAAAAYLLRGKLDIGDRTLWADVERIPAGCGFELDLTGLLRTSQFWSLDNLPPARIADPPARFAELFEDAVRLRMRSDVPVGILLSGGLDSTSIACAMKRTQADAGRPAPPLEAFSFKAAENDESAYIAATLAQTGAREHPLTIEPRCLWDTLERMLWFHDEPVHSSSALIGFELMRLAAGCGIRVVLSGQGADETAAGYHVYFPYYWYTLLQRGRVKDAWQQIGLFARTRGVKRAPLFLNSVQKAVRARLPGSRRASGVQRLKVVSEGGWFHSDFVVRNRALFIPDWQQSLDGELRRALEKGLIPVYLRVEDRNAMAHGVEARLPFLDHRLVSLLFSLPAEWKMRGPWTKYVVREAMRGRIPEIVRTRFDKFGFPTGAGQWAAAWREPVFDLLGSRAARERGIYDVDRILREFGSAAPMTEQLLRIVQFELWSRRIDQGSGTVLPAASPAVLQ